MESEAASVDFEILWYIEIHWSVCTILEMYLLPMPDFVTSYIGHLENTTSLSYVDLPNADTF